MSFGITLAHEVPKWSAYVTQKDLRWDYARLELSGALPWRIGWSVTGDIGRITGGVTDNDRASAWVRFTRPFETGPVTLTPRYTFRYLSYGKNLNDGYFDPQSYISNLVGLEVGGRTGGGRFEWSVGGDIGIENFSFDDEDEAVCDFLPPGSLQDNCRARAGSYAGGNVLFGGGESGRNTAEDLFGRIAWNISDRFTLEAYAAWTNAAAQSATGYKSHALGVAGRIRF